MKNKISSLVNNSITITVLSGIIMFVLKLLNIIQLDWIWITLPFWFGAIFFSIFLVFPFILMYVICRKK